MPALERTGERDLAVEIQEVLIRRLGADVYQLWFGNWARLVPEPEALVVCVAGGFALERLRSRYLKPLEAAAREVYGRSVAVQLRLESREEAATPAASAEDPTTPGREPAASKRRSASASSVAESSRGDSAGGGRQAAARGGPARRLQPSGEASQEAASTPGRAEGASASVAPATFHVGPCNEMAFTAARMVVEQPGQATPLFLWGPPGSGKSHLLGMIREELRRRHRMRRVIMLSGEEFTNDFTGAVRGSGLPGFRRRYRDVDALILDDVQFLGGKRATLRELLYTVDTLIKGRRQLVLVGDRPPLEMDGLTEELAGRLAGGLVCGVQPLDRATRGKVLQSMAAAAGMEDESAILGRLAEQLAGDGRILSGVVHRLRAMRQMLGRTPSWDELDASAGDLIGAGHPVVSLADIQRAVCEAFGLPGEALQSRGQQRVVSHPRMLAMYLARNYTSAAYSEIGQFFGARSHSTVIAATKRVEDWLSRGTTLRRGGGGAMPARAAISAVESLLRTG